VQHALEADLPLASPATTCALVCGHQAMVADVTALLVAAGVEPGRVLANF
jgi:hypothetical protein